jgi:hypothetical protein
MSKSDRPRGSEEPERRAKPPALERPRKVIEIPAQRIIMRADGSVLFSKKITQGTAKRKLTMEVVIPPSLADLRRRVLLAMDRAQPQIFEDLRQLADRPGVLNLRDLEGWAERWQLSERWLVEVGYQTFRALRRIPNLRSWSTPAEEDPTRYDTLLATTSHWPIDARFQGAQKFEMDAWNPAQSSEQAYRARHKTALNLYIKRVKERAKAEGLEPRKQEARERKLDPVECLVWYQILGMKPYSIAKRKGVFQQAVVRAIKKIASTLPIKLR